MLEVEFETRDTSHIPRLAREQSNETVEFMESDEERSDTGPVMCQGCNDTKYPLDHKMCPRCGFPNKEFRSSNNNDFESDVLRNKRKRLLSVENGYITHRYATSTSRLNSNSNFGRLTGKEKSRKNYDNINVSKIKAERKSKPVMKSKTRTEREEKKKKIVETINENIIRQGTKAQQKKVQTSSRRVRNMKIKKISRGVNTKTDGDCRKRVVKDILRNVVKLIDNEMSQQERIAKLVAETYNAKTRKDKNSAFLLFKESREFSLQDSYSKLFSYKELESTSDDDEVVSREKELVDLTDVLKEKKVKFIPKATVRPKLFINTEEEFNPSAKKKPPMVILSPCNSPTNKVKINLKVSNPAAYRNRKTRMSFDENFGKSDVDLTSKQEKMFQEAKLRTVNEKREVRIEACAEFNKVAKGNLNSSFRPVFYHKGVYPDPSRNDPFAVLGLLKQASRAQAKKQFRGLCILFHPDKNSHPKAKSYFDTFNKAYRKVEKVLG